MLQTRCIRVRVQPQQLIARASTTSFLRHSARRHLVTLAIETSCDDTAVAVLSHARESPATPNTTSETADTYKTKLLYNERISSDNREFKGIAPNVTVQGHQTELARMVQRAKEHIPGPDKRPDFVSATRGPGIKTNLSVGLTLAKGLAVAWGVPLVGVHHMQAHALTPRLAQALEMTERREQGDPNVPAHIEPQYPFLTLLVSGGHTEFVHSKSLVEHEIIAVTRDNAIGNVLDQTARVILPKEILDNSRDVMYGRELEAFAFPSSTDASSFAFFEPARSRKDEIADAASRYNWTVSLPFRDSRKLAYSFAGIHSRVHKIAAENPDMDVAERRALARHTMQASFQHLISRVCIALEEDEQLRQASTLVIAGGVAANKFLRHVVRSTLDARGFSHIKIMTPPLELCTDNAPMIGWAGIEMYCNGFQTGLEAAPLGKWPLDPRTGCGLLGVDGWIQNEANVQ